MSLKIEARGILSSKRYLTKSRFKLAMECPTKLFYARKEFEYKNNKSENEFLESLAEGGFQVGKMAMLLYPDGVEITASSNHEALTQTKELMQSNDKIVLFEPAFEFENLFVRVDVLVKSGNVLELIEVKAKSYDSENPDIEGKRTPIKSGILPYIEDAAFQKYVVSNALSSMTVNTFLMMPDKAVVASTDGLNQCFRIREKNGYKEAIAIPSSFENVNANKTLLTKVPIDKYIDIVMKRPLEYPGSGESSQDNLPNRVALWASAYRDDIKIEPQIHKGCKDCEFRSGKDETLRSGYHECLEEYTGLTREEIDEGTILDIWSYRKKDELIKKGIFKINQAIDLIDVKPDDNGLSYSERQFLQVAGIPPSKDRGGFYFGSDFFNSERKQWKYPYHMIDFETSTVALPFFKGMRPYESIAFQFSHHVMHEDGSVEHRSQALISDPGVFPNFDFIRELKNSLDKDEGTIFRWATHENTILNHIKVQLENYVQAPSDKNELISFIDNITDDAERSMVDLNEIALRCYFHPSTKGRTSIKKVLPAVLKTSDFLKEEYSMPFGDSYNTSLNFPNSFVWYEENEGKVVDPYELLKKYTTILFENNGATASLEDALISEGGAAAMAYARLQFEDMSSQERRSIEQALLRYCELDTLAMVMIMKAWIDWR